MKQYLVIAYDGTDAQAIERRLLARPLHFEKVRNLQQQGSFLTGGAILDEAGKMIGSTMIMQFVNDDALNTWLEDEPYIVGKVWKDITIKPFKVAQL